MGFADITPSLRAVMPDLRGRLIANEPLAPFTWLRVGGPAQALFTPADVEDLAYFLLNLPAEVPVTVIGLASNMIIRDGGVPGVVIRFSPRAFGHIAVEPGHRIRAGAFAADRKVALAAAEAGIGGLEFLFGIPGSIGGALRMNAGTRSNTNPEIEGETCERFVAAQAVTRAGAIVTLGPEDMKFAYRSCGAPADLVFTEALLQGFPRAPEEVQAINRRVQEHRERDQETRVRTAGSTFKNPPGHSSWRLIRDAGGLDLRVGKAEMSKKHANFLIAHEGASAADIETLGEEIRRLVRARSGVELEWEVKRIGVA
ncbi:UDP-N-acetylmuramate dehydrogenase [Rhabdaerophilum calidifontis]|uniref:UDP-N-acetylmuramate dehydrogenase n=1 Tax=Rhabdaerophilum calidifontis TaxID=2604328 RepID=UPI00197D748D|nr:UDP-N-acetylmuramate dehydrogenase [Rhabdaerophilum calidifontis]